MKNSTDIILGGVGGQGVLVASDILSNVALLAGFDVKKSEVHGMAQRGGSVVSHVRFGKKIYSPLVTKGEADFLLAFEKLESLRYLDFLHRDGTVLVNNQEINPMTVVTIGAKYPENIPELVNNNGFHYLNITGIQIAEELGNTRLLNVVMLGALSQYLDFQDDLWLQAIKDRLPERFFELNKKAFFKGKTIDLAVDTHK